ncbi:MAG: hypothetical protein U1F43_01960 [Myxococcota bacterium]
MTECFGSLCNLELTCSLPSTTHVGPAALEAIGAKVVWCETRIAKREARVGLAMSEKLAKGLGVGMLMLPVEPEELTEELTMAFDEAINVAIGVWNHAVEERMHWDNSVDARSIKLRHYEECILDCSAQRLGVVLGTIHLGGEAHPVAIFGHGTWPAVDGFDPPRLPKDMRKLGPETQMLLSQALGVEPAKRTVAGPSIQPRPAALPAVPPSERPRPAPIPAIGEPSEKPTEAQLGAMLVLVDRSGALRAWLSEQLRNPAFSFLKTTGSVRDQHDCRAIVLVEPTDLEFAAIRAGRMIIMDRA